MSNCWDRIVICGHLAELSAATREIPLVDTQWFEACHGHRVIGSLWLAQWSLFVLSCPTHSSQQICMLFSFHYTNFAPIDLIPQGEDGWSVLKCAISTGCCDLFRAQDFVKDPNAKKGITKSIAEMCEARSPSPSSPLVVFGGKMSPFAAGEWGWLVDFKGMLRLKYPKWLSNLAMERGSDLLGWFPCERWCFFLMARLLYQMVAIDIHDLLLLAMTQPIL